MLENRTILTVTIGYIIGIIMGLYCKISIVPFYILIFLVYLIINSKKKRKQFKLISFSRYKRYLKIIFTKKVIKIIVIFSIISNSIVLIQNYKYENLYKNFDGKELQVTGVIISNEIQKENKNVYKIKIEKIGTQKEFKNTYLYVNINKKQNIHFNFQDRVLLISEFKLPNKATNYKGFDYRNYLKTLKIYGSLDVKKVTKIGNENNIFKVTNSIFLKLKSIIESNFEKEKSSILEGILLGYTENIEENIKEEFSKSNISYILAVSGMHIQYIVLISKLISEKTIGKHKSKICTSILIIFYMFITNFSPSVTRAGISGILILMSTYFYRQSDFWNNLAISALIILIYNPFLIQSISFELSYGGTIGIFIFEPILNDLFNMYFEKLNKKAIRKNRKILKFILKIFNKKIIKKVIEFIFLTVSASIVVFPIIQINFNKINLTSLIISIISGFFIGPIVVLGIIFIFTFSLFVILKLKFINTIIKSIISLFLTQLLKIVHWGSMLRLNQINVVTPSIITVCLYYFLLFTTAFIIKVYIDKKESVIKPRLKNLISLAKYKFNQKKKKVQKIFFLLIIISLVIEIIPKNLKIHFVDVGQGDSTLIISPQHKSILIDGGGSATDFDVGEKTLMPYLLDRKISVLDYIIISHFDTDHVGGILYLMNNMKVKNIVIGKQFEKSDNLEKFMNILKEKNIKVNVVEESTRINIEKDIYFEILWPKSSQVITENTINNNALVCKLNYKTFSMLFTGDIEKEGESALVSKYGSTSVLKSTVLKVAHHRVKFIIYTRIFRTCKS